MLHVLLLVDHALNKSIVVCASPKQIVVIAPEWTSKLKTVTSASVTSLWIHAALDTRLLFPELYISVDLSPTLPCQPPMTKLAVLWKESGEHGPNGQHALEPPVETAMDLAPEQETLSTWSEWTTTDTCNQTSCGACQTQTFTRTCQKTSGCFCMGEATKTEYCNLAPCSSTTVCCNSLTSTTVNGVAICGPLPDAEVETDPVPCTTDTPTCCVLGGVWSEWSSGDACNDTCGNCGTTTLSRVCLSNDYNCECSGSTTKEAECAPAPCPFPRTTCCGARKKVIVGRTFQCSSADDSDPTPSTLCATDCCPAAGGYWSEWTTGAACPTSCGSCSTTTQNRVCLSPSTCPCQGVSSRAVNCGIGVCYFPDDSCCAGYSATVVGTQHVCGPQPNYTTPYAPYDPTCTDDCCPETGIWSEWTLSPAQCRDYCGSCGNQIRTRTCTSEADGCPCQGETTITEPCGTGVCYFPRLSCCPGFTATVEGSNHICGPLTTAVADPDKLNTCGVTCCPSAGIWGEWVSTAGCNDTCGSCGTETRKRKCLSLQYGCACTGDDTDTSVCASSVCLFPRTSCCAGFKKMVNITARTFYCGPLPVVPAFNPEQTTCCDPEKTGLWNDWGSWSTCSATCGGCGTQSRNRTCASAPYGCPCTGDSLETQSCGKQVCTTGSQCCAGKFVATGYDGAQYCQDSTPETCAGTWTEWAQIDGAVCNDTCGNCGVIPTQRYCFPSGCQCSGAYTGSQACANSVCLFPRTSCCAPYKKKIVGKAFACA
ncbi:hypothetical protein L3Y34_010696 [Caenorhabditis briggsae]|uniref:Uncharacterized protein n=1 Tax=Caenorhabditis briggsae TaxID=6238 RepID=A0AAE9CSZ9_CAEBR|nr:hypothetical protein L3Y34_010696 [Caenorhabditis briggsae]